MRNNREANRQMQSATHTRRSNNVISHVVLGTMRASQLGGHPEISKLNLPILRDKNVRTLNVTVNRKWGSRKIKQNEPKSNKSEAKGWETREMNRREANKHSCKHKSGPRWSTKHSNDGDSNR